MNAREKRNRHEPPSSLEEAARAVKASFRATIVLGSGALVLVLSRLLVAKSAAVLLGPGGLGILGLLQNLVILVGLLASLGIGTGLVRSGASALAEDDPSQAVALQRAAWVLTWGLGAVAALLLILFRVPLSAWALGSPAQASDVALMAVALLATLIAGVATATLNFRQRVGVLAFSNAASAMLNALMTIAVVWHWGTSGIAPAIVAGQVAGMFAIVTSAHVAIGTRYVPVCFYDLRVAAQTLLRFGLPYTASMLLGTGVQLLLPILVLHMLGAQSVGFYRAATEVSLGYLGFLLVAMGQDYYPRVSAASGRPAELVRLANQQLRLVLLLGVPLILGALALAPYLVPLIYSRDFTPTVGILEWQLIGDLFKFASWTLSYVILARNSGLVYFLTEAAGGALALVTTWLCVQRYGLEGLGIAFLITYVGYYAVVWGIARRDIGLVWTMPNKTLLLIAVASAVLIRGLDFVGLLDLRTPIALVLACALGIVSIFWLWFETDGVRHAHAG